MKIRYVLCTLALLAMLALAGSVSATGQPSLAPEATTTCFQDGALPTAGYAGTRDAYIRESQPVTNYGASTQLTVDGAEGATNTDRWTLIKWDVGAIPAGSSVTSASVSFVVTDDGTTQIYHQYEVTGAWDEMAVTWNTKPAWGAVSLGTVGPFGAGAQTVSLDAAVVQKWVDTPVANYGLIMADSTNTSGFDLYSSEAATAGNRPKLCVTYGGGGGGAAIIKGPFVQNPTTKGVAILWEANANAACQLRQRQHTTPLPAWTTLTGITPKTVLGRYLYEKPLTGVKSYEDYQVSCDGGATWVPDPPASFRKALGTASTATFTIAAYGDSRWDARLATYEHEAVIKALVKDKPRIVLQVGDIVRIGQCYANQPGIEGWWEEYFKPAQSLIGSVAVLPAAGNHEYKTECAPAERIWYYDYFNLPGNGVAGQAEKWYAFNYGCARFISLNTYDGDTITFSFSQAQQDWLNAEMNSAAYLNAKWQIVYMHTPLHQWPDDAPRRLRSTLQTLFKNKGVDLVLEGHIHRYERGVQDGVPYVITGGGGAPLDDCATNPMPGRITCASANQYTTLKFACGSPSSLTFKSLNKSRIVIDSFTVPPSVAGVEPVLIENTELIGLEAPVEEEAIDVEEDFLDSEAADEATDESSVGLGPDDLPFRLWLPVVNP